jgi:hypothetical protein
MSNYTKATNFTAKDSLPTGDSNKIVKGTEVDVELTAIASAISSKADSNSPTFTGTPTAPTAAAGTNTTQIATTAFVATATGSLGTISTQDADDVAITGGSISGTTITATTQTTGNNTTNVATTAFVQQEITANAYTLPYASTSTKGGIRITVTGNRLDIYTTA